MRPGIERPFDLQHDFGFNVGGPVYLPHFGEGGPIAHSLKNRTFFFFNYEGYRFNQSESVNVSVPTLRMRQGDFSSCLMILQFCGSFRTAYRSIAPLLPLILPVIRYHRRPDRA
jgi:hypothetical protein